MPAAIQKFGGSSLATPEKIRQVAEVVARSHAAERGSVVVVSARGEETDVLLSAAAELGAAPPPRELDQLLATGRTPPPRCSPSPCTTGGCPPSP